MNIPSVIIAGDSLSWTDSAFADSSGNRIDSGTYALAYSFRGAIAGGNVDVTATASGTGWTTALTPAQTAAMNTGSSSLTVYWHATATKSGKRITAGNGTLFLKPNIAALSAASAYEGRTQAEQDLAAVRAEMSARISGGATVEYTIGSRSLKKEPMSALMEMEQRCLRIVASEKRANAAANGLGNPGRLMVRF